jgi:2,4-dienoyl-CoA reductase-like NADH-dependent reductase (Old Yellow Enzyme family)
LTVAPLFSPLSCRLSLANRIVMAPMTRRFSPGGVPGPAVAEYYRKRAEHDVGLIITEGTVVEHPAAADGVDVPRFYGEDALAGWREVADAVHAAGGRIVPQLWHVGLLRPQSHVPYPEAPPIGPSGTDPSGRNRGEPMTDSDIAAVIDAFARAASDAERLGFDGVELHAAHGYLIDQFFWTVTNGRVDRYGGDIGRRSEFAAEIIRACRGRVGQDFPILLRFSQWKLQRYAARLAHTPQDLERMLAPLIDAGVDVFDCSTRRFWDPEFEGSDLNLAAWTKRMTGRAVIMVGGVWQHGEFLTHTPTDSVDLSDRLIQAAAMVERGDVDLVAVGRALLGDAQWARKVRCGASACIQPYSRSALTTLA